MEETQILFELFGLRVTPYALCVAIAVLAGFLLLEITGGKSLKKGTLEPLTALLIPMALLGARLFYVLARLSFYREIGMENALALWDGGYALWGAAGGAVCAAAIMAKCTGQKLSRILDTLIAPGMLVIALCRFAEYFSGEGIGPEVENEALCFFPMAVYSDWLEIWNYSVFIPEGLVALAVCILLLCRKSRRDGDQARLGIILYCSAQVVLESLRRDNCLRWLFVRVSQLTAVIVLLFLALAGLYRWKKTQGISRRRMITVFVVFFVLTGLCILLEFAVDKSPMSLELIYALMAVFGIGLGICSGQAAMKN